MEDNGNATDIHHAGVESPLLNSSVDGVVDYKGRPVLRSRSGCWRSAYFIIGMEVVERFAYFGVSSNLITYLTGPLRQSTANPAQNINLWYGTASLLPVVGAFIADAFLGRYLTIVIASLLYVLAFGLLAFSTLIPPDCKNAMGDSSCSPQIQVIIFFVSLYLITIAQGRHKPCGQAFGADQFDANDPEELKSKSSFFNWWYFGMCVGPTVRIFVLSYIQDNFSWGLCFGIPCIIMGLSMIIFLSGTMTYRYGKKNEEKNAFVRIGRVFIVTARNWRATPLAASAEKDAYEIMPHQGSQQFRFVNKALVRPNGSNEEGIVCSREEVDEAKAILRLIPIWVSCLGYGIVFAQISTFFTKQGATMDRSIGSTFEIPAAALQSFGAFSLIILIPIYDTILVPLTRALTNIPTGITMLQRVGTGFFISIVSMIVAAMVETKRLKIANDYGVSKALIPMKIWWLLPQHLLTGASSLFSIVGMQEFFYDQMPNDLRSIGLALYLGILGIGSFLSSFTISIVDKTTSKNGEDGWISDNLDQGHLDYFYYLLAGISAIEFVMFIYFAKSYVYN